MELRVSQTAGPRCSTKDTLRPAYILQIARFTLQEAISRRLILAGVLISLGYIGLFALGSYLKKGPITGLASVLWALYTGYEFLMKFRLLCSGECNIRVDLLVLYPSLLLVSLAAIVEFLVRRRKEPDGPI